MGTPRTAILHYSSSPTVGGVESVIDAQAAGFIAAGYPVTVVSGRGEASALPAGSGYIAIPEMHSQHPAILAAALARFLEGRPALRGIAWCHDFTWTSAHSRPRVHDGYPWDLLRTRLPGVAYVTISERRRSELAGLLGCREKEIGVIPNGVEPALLFGLSEEGRGLVERLGLLDCGLSLLMPVRVTQAKNIEYAIRLAAALAERGADPRVVLTGPPDPHDPESMAYFESLHSLAHGLGVEREMRFVYESRPKAGEPYRIGMERVGELYRVCDLLFMPSHREGFGMPILEAGLLGMPVVCTRVPAADEIGREDFLTFDPGVDPVELADRILAFARSSPSLRLRARVRRTYTWQALFRREIAPLIAGRPDRDGGDRRIAPPGG